MDPYEKRAVRLRRQLHMYPEIGFHLPKTLELVRKELTLCGIPFTEKYGQSSIVAVLNETCTDFTIGIRADMDALPIQEQTSLPFQSRIPGQMHACGHDVHTAILLAVARKLNDQKERLRCRVMLIFQPAEEYIQSGAKTMTEKGVMEDIDCIIGCHVDSDFPTGTVAVDEGGQGANSLGFTVDMQGSSIHAADQYLGRDAILMCMEAYQLMHNVVAKEVSARQPCVLNIGKIAGGETNNVVCDHCHMFATLRTQSDALNDSLTLRFREISEAVARLHGGEARFEVRKFLPYVWNEAAVTARMRQTAEALLGPEKVLHKQRNMCGEDFAFFCRQKPGVIFRLGIRNEEEGSIYIGHTGLFRVDENCIGVGIQMFTNFVWDHMDGFPLPEKVEVE